MIVSPTVIPGAHVIELERHVDERGFFARTFCVDEFQEHGLNPRIAQCNVSQNRVRGTLRGMHYQAAPFREAKLVRCTAGAIHDVIVDLRPSSPTRLQWLAVELSAANRRMLYVPEGVAHGFITLEDDTEVSYQMSESYAPDAARGFRWNDPRIAITWPIEPTVISERDRSYPGIDVAAFEEVGE